MKIAIEDKLHKVVYIEYQKGLPHAVVTQYYVPNAVGGPYWRNDFWDFFPNAGDRTEICACHAGNGGNQPAPQWADGYIGEFWIDKDFKLEGEPKNYKILAKPKRIKSYMGSSINPFKIAEITHSSEYCEECGKTSRDICWEHVYEDEDDDYTLKYKSDNSCY